MTNALTIVKPDETSYVPAHIGGHIPTSLAELSEFAALFVQSGMFAETRQAAQAAVKILRGAELGMTPFAAMDGLHIIQGRITMSANTMAALIQKSQKYRYRIKSHSDNECLLEFSEKTEAGWEVVGQSGWTRQDAQRAGTKNMDKYPRNMTFARALSNGFRLYCPELSHGAPLYVPEDMGAQTDDSGRVVIETSFVHEQQTQQSAPSTQAAKSAEKKAPSPLTEAKKYAADRIKTILCTDKVSAKTAVSLAGNLMGLELNEGSALDDWDAFGEKLHAFIEQVHGQGHEFGAEEWFKAVSLAVGWPVDTLTALAKNDWNHLFHWLNTGEVALANGEPGGASEETPDEDEDL